ncbi:MAG: DegV family EDD domain-containing protein, partial [candidate division KSB1 bacterium]|nr:DegV family EDD domain-containing protein [candidate division KSB1 bacterium]
GKWRLTTSAFAAAVQKARQSAQDALAEPREGTILTVINDWANYIEKSAKKTEDFVVLLKSGLQRARRSLAETPKKLEVLKKAGVVDAGAQGFVHILEGIIHFIDKGKIEKIIDQPVEPESSVGIEAPKEVDSDIQFRYCTECMVTANAINHALLKKALRPLGNSLIVAGSATRVRVHVHTNSPEAVFEAIGRYGEISERKIDDMVKQHQHLYSKAQTGGIGIVTDSSCDLPYQFIKENHIHIIPLKLIFGDQTYLDKVNISPMEFYDKLLTSPHHPSTSQPAIADVLKVYEEVLPQYESILSIHLPRVVSGTFQTIERAAAMTKSGKITCIDGKGISGALGLVVMEAVDAIKAGLSVDQVKERVQRATENIKIFIMLPTLKYLVRGGRVSKPKGLIGKLLGLKPIVSFDPDGRVFLAAKAIGEQAAMKKTLKMAQEYCRQFQRLKFIVAHANAYARANWYVAQLKKIFHIKDDIPIVDAAPVLGVHSGPGTAGFAVIGYND